MTTGTRGGTTGGRPALSPGKTFTEVLQAARAGAAWAFERLYADLAPPVAGYLRVQGAASPAEVTSAVFLEVFGELDRFHGGFRQFRIWVLTVAHRHLAGADRLGTDPAGQAGERYDEWLLRVSAVLSGEQRTVLALRLAAGLTADEVAEVTGEPVGAVRDWQREGLAALQRHLTQDRPARTPCE